jgi:hypothetical protein
MLRLAEHTFQNLKKKKKMCHIYQNLYILDENQSI